MGLELEDGPATEKPLRAAGGGGGLVGCWAVVPEDLWALGAEGLEGNTTGPGKGLAGDAGGWGFGGDCNSASRAAPEEEVGPSSLAAAKHIRLECTSTTRGWVLACGQMN